MKYLMLAYTKLADWDALDPNDPEFLRICQFYDDLAKELTASGEFVLTEGLGHPALSRTARRQPGGPVITDGPFAEAKEVLASLAILDCASYDRAMEIAARVADATGDVIEVRPIMEGPPQDGPLG